jgi:hypothetical protein
MLPGFGCPSGGLGLTCLLIAQVQEALGPDRPPRYKQGCVLGDHRVGVDDAKVHAGHLTRVQVVMVDGYGGGDGQPELPTIGHQGHRPDPVGRIRDGASRPHPQRGAAPGDGQPHPPAVQLKGLVVEADRDQQALAAWEPGRFAFASPLGSREPRVRVPGQHRSGPHY